MFELDTRQLLDAYIRDVSWFITSPLRRMVWVQLALKHIWMLPKDRLPSGNPGDWYREIKNWVCQKHDRAAWTLPEQVVKSE